MKSNVNFSDFVDSFSETYKNNFSYEGKKALYDYLIDFEDGTGEELELDPIAFCCEFTEYDNLEELQASYPDIETMEDLEDHTTVIMIPDTEKFIIQEY